MPRQPHHLHTFRFIGLALGILVGLTACSPDTPELSIPHLEMATKEERADTLQTLRDEWSKRPRVVSRAHGLLERRFVIRTATFFDKCRSTEIGHEALDFLNFVIREYLKNYPEDGDDRR